MELASSPPILSHTEITGGRFRSNTSMPNIPVHSRENPIHRPENRQRNIKPNNTIDIIKGSEIIGTSFSVALTPAGDQTGPGPRG